jgi:hypothetical protein
MSDSHALHPRWPPLLKIEISSKNLEITQFDIIPATIKIEEKKHSIILIHVTRGSQEPVSFFCY